MSNQPTEKTEYVTIPLEEYAYLKIWTSLWISCWAGGDYSAFRNVAAVRDSIREMKQRKVAGGNE